MNNQLARATTLRKFNPGAMQTDEEIIKQFVVRKHQFNAVMEVLEENMSSESNQHLLIVAPRGRGKTMLLARVAAELRQNPKFSSQLLPVRFMEESMEVLCIADFWLECLLHLINALNELHTERAEALRATRAELSKIMDNKQLEQLARAAVLEVADELDYRLVLTIENLQDLASDTDKDFGWHLRKTLQTVPRIILVASATSHFEGLFDVDQPFFELFREIELPPLNIKECQNLWQAATGMSIEEREIKPLKILTGGSPRLLIFIASFSRHHSMRQLMEELVTLIDDHTEYFRGHLDALPAKERRVYIAVLDLWQPATTKEISERARMEIRSTSSLLNRLVHRGAVTTEKEGKTKYYCSTERLHSIYYKLRREGNEASVVQGLVMFMTAFYTGDEFQVMATNLLEESREMPSLKQGVQLAMRNNKHARERLMTYMSYDDCHVALGEKTDACDWVEHHSSLALDAFERTDYISCISHLDKIIARFKGTSEPALQEQVATAFFNRGVALTENKRLEKALEDYAEIINCFSNSAEPAFQE
ncbi:MAG: AAA family ATPase, partial [Gammaproteobacteria bacterium]|nr:AAA family ATPase [Gammaproteobacteria bacterium]